MNNKAFYSLSYGLYLLSTTMDGKDAGCVVNTIQQVTSDPARLSVAVNKQNYTGELIGKSGVFSGTVFLADTSMDIIRTFGFSSSRDRDKFAGLKILRDGNGVPFLTDGMAARFSCKVAETLDVGTHMLYVGDVVEAETLNPGEVMTYAYYHKVKNGTTPPNAPGYQKEAPVAGWRCTVCGYIYEGAELPPDYVCPVCGATADKFQRV